MEDMTQSLGTGNTKQQRPLRVEQLYLDTDDILMRSRTVERRLDNLLIRLRGNIPETDSDKVEKEPIPDGCFDKVQTNIVKTSTVVGKITTLVNELEEYF